VSNQPLGTLPRLVYVDLWAGGAGLDAWRPRMIVPRRPLPRGVPCCFGVGNVRCHRTPGPLKLALQSFSQAMPSLSLV
jgi:hypothetical protein